MNRVIIESSIDKLDQIEYLIENENNDKKVVITKYNYLTGNAKTEELSKEEMEKREKELKEKQKKILKKIGIVIGIGTAVLTIGNTILKVSQVNSSKSSMNKFYDSIEKDTKDVMKEVDSGIENLKDLKNKVNDSNKKHPNNILLNSYENEVDNYKEKFIGYKNDLNKIQENDLKDLKKDVDAYNKLNPIFTSRRKLTGKIKDMSKKGDAILSKNHSTKVDIDFNKKRTNNIKDMVGGVIKQPSNTEKSLFDAFK